MSHARCPKAVRVDPTTNSDPTGLRLQGDAGKCPATTPGCPGYDNGYNGGGGGNICYYCSSSSGGTTSTTGNPTLADIMNLRGLPLNLPVLNNFSLSDIRALRGLDLAEITGHRGLACLGPGAVGHYCPTGGNLLGQIGHFVWKNRGTIATVFAVGVCLSGFGTFACGGALAGAYVVRAEQRIGTYGFSRSIRANAADAVMTTWFAIPMAGAIITFGAFLPLRYRMIVNGVSTIPDDVQLVGGFLPGHDRVFFNGNTLSP